MNVYIGYGVEFNGELSPKAHVTLAYGDCQPTSRMNMNLPNMYVQVTDIVYWPHVDLTVMLVDGDRLHEVYKGVMDAGFTYNHEFKPHITLCKGDATDTLRAALREVEVRLVNPFIQIKGPKHEPIG